MFSCADFATCQHHKENVKTGLELEILGKFSEISLMKAKSISLH